MRLKILVACEESQAVTIQLRKLGHEAYSCDLLPCGGRKYKWHLQQDVIPLLDDDWDMILAFPPCDHLASSGARWFKLKREDGRQQQAIEFFMKFTDLKCQKVAIENPVGIMSTVYRKPDQIIHPWQFGHGEKKTTCLWLKNLPPLIPTNIVDGRAEETHNMPPYHDRGRARGQTYEGVAKAMAEQWAGPAKRRNK